MLLTLKPTLMDRFVTNKFFWNKTLIVCMAIFQFLLVFLKIFQIFFMLFTFLRNLTCLYFLFRVIGMYKICFQILQNLAFLINIWLFSRQFLKKLCLYLQNSHCPCCLRNRQKIFFLNYFVKKWL